MATWFFIGLAMGGFLGFRLGRYLGFFQLGQSEMRTRIRRAKGKE